MKFYHYIVEDKHGNRFEVIRKAQGRKALPPGTKIIGVCGYHETPKGGN